MASPTLYAMPLASAGTATLVRALTYSGDDSNSSESVDWAKAALRKRVLRSIGGNSVLGRVGFFQCTGCANFLDGPPGRFGLMCP